jgi:hypothetical protein
MLSRPCTAVVIDAHWLGGFSTNWDHAQNWDTTDLMGNPVRPNNHPAFDPSREYNVIIDNNSGANHVVEILSEAAPGARNINNLRVDAGDVLSMRNGTLVIEEPTLENNGQILVGNNSEYNSNVTVTEPVTTFSGNGMLKLAIRHQSRLQGENVEIVNAASHTIAGAGWIHGTGVRVTNHGTIDANIEPIPVHPVSNANVLEIEAQLTNHGILRASNGGAVWLTGPGARTSYANTAGIITAADGSTIEIKSNADVSGGTLSTSGSGVIKVSTNGSFADVTLTPSSNMQITGISALAQGTFTNNGRVDFLAGAKLALTDHLMLTGNGRLIMKGIINGAVVTKNLVNDSSHTIEGYGKLGESGLVVDNRGLISGNVSGQIMTVEPAFTGSVNSGTMRATAGGTMGFVSNRSFTNSGILEALNGSSLTNVLLTNSSGGTLTGGTYRSIDGGSGATFSAVGTPIATIAANTTIELSGPNSVMTFGGTNLQTSLQNNSGTLKLSSGRLFNMLTHSYTQSATGTLEIGLAPANSYGKLDTDATATLAGTLNVTLVNGYLPVSGNSFDILDSNTLIGTFSTLQLPTLEAGLSWDTSQLYTTGVLSVTGSTALPGDFNHDNAVNAADYVVWRKTNGTTAGFNLWRANFGNMAGSGAALPSAASLSASVPESAALTVLAIGMSLYFSFAPRRVRAQRRCLCEA